jgi:hypothetical protein
MDSLRNLTKMALIGDRSHKDRANPHYTPPPPPSHNGGLYTGEPFWPGAPWRNFPVTPDTSHYVHLNLRSATPPHQALYQYPSADHRPGNNFSPMPGIKALAPPYADLQCATSAVPVTTPAKAPRFAKYAYL